MNGEAVLAFARDELDFPLYPRQAAIVREIYDDGIRTAALRLGRRSGKGRIAAVVATAEACVNAGAHLAAVPPGEQVGIAVIATSQAQARVVHRYVRAFLQRPSLAPLVLRDTEDSIELRNGLVILTLPCNAASTRGLALAVVILDEAAWFTGKDGSPLDAREIYDSLIPATAQFPDRRVIITSTPRWSVGWFAEVCALASSGKYPDMRHWHATTAQMNASIPASFLAAEREKDPPSFRREYEAEWDSGIGALYESSFIRAAVREQGDLPYRDDAGRYVIAIDAAFTGDTFSVLCGHREPRDLTVVVDRVQGWRGTKAQPVLLDPTLDAIGALSAAYGGAEVVIDQYAAQPIRQGLTQRGLHVTEKPWTNEAKMTAATAVRRVLYADRLSIPDHSELIAELTSLEQRPLPTGRARIAAPAGGHDDYAMALLALVDALERAPHVSYSTSYLPDDREPTVRRGDLVLEGDRFVDKEPRSLADYLR